MEKIRVALIGCGGRQNVHIGGLAALDGDRRSRIFPIRKSKEKET